MVTLYCAVVGVAGSAFPVDIDPTLSVGHLKKAIKDKQKNGLKDVDADKLLLFLAEKKACGWLDEDEAAAVSFDVNGHPEGFKLMKPSWFLENPEYFGATFQPGQGQIHVLVVVPVCGAKDDAWSAKELSTLDPDVQSRVWKVVKVSSPDVCSGTALVVDQTPTHLYLLMSLHLWTDSTFTDSLSPAFQNEIKAGRKRKEPDVKDAKVAPRKYSRTAARNATALSDKPEVVVEQLFPDMTKPGEVYRFRLDSDVCWRSSSVFNFAIFAVPVPEDHTNLSPCKMSPLLNVGMSVSVFGFPGTPEDHGHAYTIAPAETTGWSRNQVILASLAAPGLPGSAIVYNKAVALGYILGGREGPASMNEQHAYSFIGVIPVLPSSS